MAVLRWTAVDPDVGVLSYQPRRNGVVLTTLGPTARSHADPGGSGTYDVVATLSNGTTVTSAPKVYEASQPPGSVLFDSNLASGGVTAYAADGGSIQNPQCITVVSDPVLGAVRKVIKVTVNETDTFNTPNPRSQLETGKKLAVGANGAEFYAGFSFLLPAGFPAQWRNDKWITLAEVYGPPYDGSSPSGLGHSYLANNTTLRTLAIEQENLLLGNPTRGAWVDIVTHTKLSTDPAVGFVQHSYNLGQGWVYRPKQSKATVTAANGGGANYHKLACYYALGTGNAPLTVYFAAHKLATSGALAAPNSHGQVWARP